MDIPHFMYAFLSWCKFGVFPYSLSNVTVNICVQVFVRTLVFVALGCILRNRTESNGNFIFNL